MGYEKSKIYKLQHEDGHFYIGSTINELRVRLKGHKDKSKQALHRALYSHINEEWDKVKIVLIEAFECSNRNELRQKEDQYIQKELANPFCLNCIKSYCSPEDYAEYNKNYQAEYRIANADKQIAYRTEYYEKNKDKIKQKSAEYYHRKKQQNASQQK